MSDIEEINKHILGLIISINEDETSISRNALLDIYKYQQQTIDKLNKEADRWSNELDLQLKYSEYERKKNAKLLNANILLANERLKLKEEIEGLNKLSDYNRKMFNKEFSKNTKLKEGLNDIKSQLFDVNNCDTILTSAIEQILKNK